MIAPLASPANIQDLRQRHPEAFAISWRQRALLGATGVACLALFVFGIVRLDITYSRLLSGLRQIGGFIALMMPPTAGNYFWLYTNALVETLAIAFLGTLVAAVLALPVGLLVARNVLPVWIVRFLGRRFLDTIRGVDTLIWALIWIGVVGLGPFAGVLAIATSDFGAFGKLFAEAIESADRRPSEGIRSVGGSAIDEIRFGLVPQVLPIVSGLALYYFESNVRSATIIGIVGAGGIGLHLSEQIRTLEWRHVAFIVLMILAAVALIDWLSAKLRFAIIGRRAI